MQMNCYAYTDIDDIKQGLLDAITKEISPDNHHTINMIARITQDDIPDYTQNKLCIERVYLKPKSMQYVIHSNFVNIKDKTTSFKEFRGQYEHNVATLTFNKTINKGDIIRTTDIAHVEVPYRKLPYGTVDNIDSVIGLTVKHRSHAYIPIVHNNLLVPELVKKNDVLRLKYDGGNLSIETKAIALDGGARGDSIKVRNLKSNKIIVGTIVNNATVKVE